MCRDAFARVCRCPPASPCARADGRCRGSATRPTAGSSRSGCSAPRASRWGRPCSSNSRSKSCSASSSIGERQTCTARTKQLCWSRTVSGSQRLRSPTRARTRETATTRDRPSACRARRSPGRAWTVGGRIDDGDVQKPPSGGQQVGSPAPARSAGIVSRADRAVPMLTCGAPVEAPRQVPPRARTASPAPPGGRPWNSLHGVNVAVRALAQAYGRRER